MTANAKLFLDCAYTSLNKKGEELCGDKVEIIKSDDRVTMVLADGLGSGVKANILATLTSKIVGTMLARGVSIDECVDTIINTLPVCKVRKVAYSTFSIAQIMGNECVLIQYDNPQTLVFKRGVCYDYPYTKRKIGDKEIIESRFTIEDGDAIFMYSDGVIHAGVGKFFNFGWTLEEVRKHTEIFYQDLYTAKSLSALVASSCNDLYDGLPGDDTSVGVIKIREGKELALMIGPPVDKSVDQEMCEKFMSYDGYKIVCGGSTSHVISNYLKEDIVTNLEYFDREIPPTATMKGVDLVTEGSLTIHRALEIIKQLNKVNCLDYDFGSRRDGASLLVRFLLEKATDIHLLVGRALNPAHQKFDFPINFNSKLKMIEEFAGEIRKFGREVNIEYF